MKFVGIDIPKEVRDFMNMVEPIGLETMTDSELQAYQMGISNSIKCLSEVLCADVLPVHITGLDMPEIFNIHQLQKYADKIKVVD